MSSQTNRRRKRDPYEGLSEITRRLGWQARSERNLPSGVVPARGTDARRLIGDRHSRRPPDRDRGR